jgi:hypothetical protein
VYDFLKYDVGFRVVRKVRKGDNTFKVAAMSVYIAGHDHRPMRRQTNQIAPSEFVCVVGLHSFIQQLGYFIGHFSSPDG